MFNLFLFGSAVRPPSCGTICYHSVRHSCVLTRACGITAWQKGQVLMNVLLLSMPDSFEHMPPVAIRMPNGALTSLAGNVDPHHRVAVADLILVHREVRETVTRLVRELDPEVVGLSIMTFQRRTAGRVIELVRSLRPGVKIVVGGYDPSLAPEAYAELGVDYLVRSEGEITFRELLRAIEAGAGFQGVWGISSLH